jgi:hypothetical protein
MENDRFEAFLTDQDKSRIAALGLLRALTGVAVAAVFLVMVAAAAYIGSQWVQTEALSSKQGVGGRPRLSASSYTYYVVGVVMGAALLVVAGAWFDVTERTRTLLMSLGGGLLVFVGGSVVALFRPGRADLRGHFEVGEVGTETEWVHWVYALDALGLLIAACGVAALVLMVVQKRRIAARYPG